MPQFSNVSMTGMLAELVDTGNYLDGVTIHLFKDDFFPGPLSVPADLAAHEADFDGYAASAAVTFLAPYVAPDGSGVVPGESVQFIPTGTTTPNIIFGWWMQHGTAGSAILIEWGRLPESVALATPFDSLVIDPTVVIAPGQP